MGQIVSFEDVDQSKPQKFAVSTTPALASGTRIGATKRSFISIIPITAGITVTVTLGAFGAIADQGVDLLTNQPFAQSLDSNGKGVYQGEVYLTASGAGFVSMQETFENGGVQ